MVWGFQAGAHVYERLSAAILKLQAQDKAGSALWDSLKSTADQSKTVIVMLEEFEDRLETK